MSTYLKWLALLVGFCGVCFLGGYVYNNQKENIDELLGKNNHIYVFPNNLIIQTPDGI